MNKITNINTFVSFSARPRKPRPDRKNWDSLSPVGTISTSGHVTVYTNGTVLRQLHDMFPNGPIPFDRKAGLGLRLPTGKSSHFGAPVNVTLSSRDFSPLVAGGWLKPVERGFEFTAQSKARLEPV